MKGDLVCAFGELWLGPHPLCDEHADRLEQAFDAAVTEGTYDVDGYTPTERKAQARRAVKATDSKG